ncbi:MAG: hypothetical protein ACRDKL_11180 [Solirubrobacteraceae bacterium]
MRHALRGLTLPILAAAAAVLVVALGAPVAAADPPVLPGEQVSSAAVSTNLVRTVPQSFLGFSMNVEEMEDYTQLPAFTAIINNVLNTSASGNGPFVLRLGGTYVDSSYWDGEESQVLPMFQAAPAFAVQLDQNWMNSLANVVRQTGSKVILNVNAVAHDPQMATDFVRDAEQTLPAGSLMDVAIGNEPDNYNNPIIPVARNDAWSRGLTPATYASLFGSYARVLHTNFPGLGLAGPESTGSWSRWTSTLLQKQAGKVGLVTSHVYPLNACAPAGSAQYPALDTYLQSSLVTQTTQSLQYLLSLAQNLGLPYRLTELGSGTCGGVDGVNNTFVTSLWVINQLFSFVSAGLDGVNIHLRANAPNTALAQSSATASGLQPEPLLYGLAAFASALEPGDALTQVTGTLQPDVNVWALYGSEGWHLALVNTSSSPQLVDLSLPAAGQMAVTPLSAPAPSSTSVSFGGQTITPGGSWSGPLQQTDVQPSGGSYPVLLGPDSAAIADVAALPGTTITASAEEHHRAHRAVHHRRARAHRHHRHHHKTRHHRRAARHRDPGARRHTRHPSPSQRARG